MFKFNIIVNFEHISHLFLIFLMSQVNISWEFRLTYSTYSRALFKEIYKIQYQS